MATQKLEINNAKFINKGSHFIVANNEGFFVCDKHTADIKVSVKIPGGCSLADCYKKSNIFFVVGTGHHVEFPETRLVLWDAATNQKAGNVQFHPDLKIVDVQVLGPWVMVFFKNSSRLFHMEQGFQTDKTIANFPCQDQTSPRTTQTALHASDDFKTLTVAYAEKYEQGKINCTTYELGQNPQTKNMQVPKGEPIVGISFGQDGTLLHVASAKGTVLNTFLVSEAKLVKQFGRGKHHAVVNSISSDGQYLVCCSDRKTTHLFNISDSMATSQQVAPNDEKAALEQSSQSQKDQAAGGQDNNTPKNTFSKLYYLSSLVSYYGYEFSFAKLNLADKSAFQICYVENEHVFLLTSECNYHVSPINGFETKLGPPIKIKEKLQMNQ